MDDLVVWLRQQLADDECAVAAILRRDPTWRVDPEPWPNGVGVLDGKGDGVAIAIGDYAAEHIALHDPARVRRDVEAKRRMIDLALRMDYGLDEGDLLHLLALPYSERPGYREEWKP